MLSKHPESNAVASTLLNRNKRIGKNGTNDPATTTNLLANINVLLHKAESARTVKLKAYSEIRGKLKTHIVLLAELEITI